MLEEREFRYFNKEGISIDNSKAFKFYQFYDLSVKIESEASLSQLIKFLTRAMNNKAI
jgi:hypothetical protein